MTIMIIRVLPGLSADFHDWADQSEYAEKERWIKIQLIHHDPAFILINFMKYHDYHDHLRSNLSERGFP